MRMVLKDRLCIVSGRLMTMTPFSCSNIRVMVCRDNPVIPATSTTVYTCFSSILACFRFAHGVLCCSVDPSADAAAKDTTMILQWSGCPRDASRDVCEMHVIAMDTLAVGGGWAACCSRKLVNSDVVFTNDKGRFHEMTHTSKPHEQHTPRRVTSSGQSWFDPLTPVP